MVFNSIDFLLFFPIVVMVYFVIPKKVRYIWLLITSYYFYIGWNSKYAFLIALSTIITYFASIMIYFFEIKGAVFIKKIFLYSSIISNISILLLFKYGNFIIQNLNRMMSVCGMEVIDREFDFLLPVGISFYTFQALSYTIDVYWGKIKPEKNILRYALYVSFFPQLVAGPIERSVNLLPQIQNIENIAVFDYARIKSGILYMMWGLFQKMVIADRASLLVDNVINNYSNYGFIEIMIAMVLFAVQIYCDFGGYTNIAIGAAKVMGFSLMKNFNQPYLASDVKQFWRRWHISLTSWFTDYVYIPLGGNKMGELRKYINIIVVFMISGLWHGASWNYVAWGGLHAIYQVVGSVRKKICGQKKSNDESISKRIRNAIGTFILVDFAWIFFVANSMRHALDIIRQMLSCFQTTDVFKLGLDRGNWSILLIGIGVLFAIDICKEKSISIYMKIDSQELWFKGLTYILLIWATIMFGIYGIDYDASTFIYFQF